MKNVVGTSVYTEGVTLPQDNWQEPKATWDLCIWNNIYKLDDR